MDRFPCVLEVESKGFTDGFHLRDKKTRRIKDDSEVLIKQVRKLPSYTESRKQKKGQMGGEEN